MSFNIQQMLMASKGEKFPPYFKFKMIPASFEEHGSYWVGHYGANIPTITEFESRGLGITSAEDIFTSAGGFCFDINQTTKYYSWSAFNFTHWATYLPQKYNSLIMEYEGLTFRALRGEYDSFITDNISYHPMYKHCEKWFNLETSKTPTDWINVYFLEDGNDFVTVTFNLNEFDGQTLYLYTTNVVPSNNFNLSDTSKFELLGDVVLSAYYKPMEYFNPFTVYVPKNKVLLLATTTSITSSNISNCTSTNLTTSNNMNVVALSNFTSNSASADFDITVGKVKFMCNDQMEYSGTPIIVTTDYASYQLLDDGSEDNPHILKGDYINSIECPNVVLDTFFYVVAGRDMDHIYPGQNDAIVADKFDDGSLSLKHIDLTPYRHIIDKNWCYNLYISCYLTGTTITLADGTYKSVESLTYDDEILVWDFDNGHFASSKALWITKPQIAYHYYLLKFSDGTELKLTGSDDRCHRLLNIENCEFTYGSHFNVGQHTFKDDETTPYLVSIERIEEEVEFYNVATHYHMNCFANGILSSCGYNNIYPIKNMKFVKDNRDIVPFETYINIPREFYDSLRLGEQDLSKRSVEKAENYIGRMLKVMQ